MKKICFQNLEAIIWLSALAWLALLDSAGETHFTFCPLQNLGVDWCPGCGLGRAVSCALHGQLAESLRHHMLGIPAIVILGARITALARFTFDRYSKPKHVITHNRKPYAQRHAIDADS